MYSTCSIHQIENEDVINSVLPLAASYGFQLSTPFPRWQRRGLPVFEGCKCHSVSLEATCGISRKRNLDSIFGKSWNGRYILACLFLFCAAQHLLRTDPVEDGEGFFIALFTKRNANTVNCSEKQATCKNTSTALARDRRTNRLQNVKKKFVTSCPRTKLFQTWLHAKQSRRRCRRPKCFHK